MISTATSRFNILWPYLFQCPPFHIFYSHRNWMYFSLIAISWALPNFLAHFSFSSSLFSLPSIKLETHFANTKCYLSWPYLLPKPFGKSPVLDKLSTSTLLCPNFQACVGIISTIVYAEFIIISFPKSHQSKYVSFMSSPS